MEGIIQNKSRTPVQYSAVSLSANSQAQGSQIISTVADVTGIDLNLSVTAAGTLVGAKPVTNAIQRLVVADRNGKLLMDVAGTDLPFIAMLLNQRGAYDTPAVAVDATAVKWNDVLGITAPLSVQPLYFQVTFAPYSALATSGCTGATVSLTVNVWYGSTANTTRIYKKSVSVVSGSNEEGVNLVNGANTQIMGFSIITESNLSSVTFSSDGKIDDYSRIFPQQIIDLENDVYRDKHQTGMFNLFVAPFVASIQNTRLTFEASGSDTVNIYQIAYD